MNDIQIDSNVPLIEIESGIPLAPKVSSRKRQWIYPFPKMKLGDSFFVNNVTTKTMSPHISRAKETLKRNFTQRTSGKGVRVWRIP